MEYFQPLRQYTLEHSLRLTPEEEQLREITSQHRGSRMMGSEECLQLIHNLIYSMNAKKVLDIGVYTGCSALAEALALPEDGKVYACDINEEVANIGKPFWEKAGVAKKIILKIGNAIDTLDQLIADGEAGTFDFAFIDADKINYPNYYEKCLILLRPRGIIAFDDIFWDGKVFDPKFNDEETNTFRKLNKQLKSDPRVKVSMLCAGDGLTLAFKR